MLPQSGKPVARRPGQERRWNEALARVDRLRAQLDEFTTAVPLQAPERMEDWLRLADELAAAWHDPACDVRLKKRIVRTLIEEILAEVDMEAATVHLVIHWAGGAHTELTVRKHRTGEHRYRTDRSVVELVRHLARVASDPQIAAILNRLGYRTGHGNSWTRSRVNTLRASHGIPCFDPAQREGWVTLTEAAQVLDISPMSVHRLLERGLLKGQQVVPHAPWLIRREDLTAPAVVQAVEAIRQRRGLPLPEAGGQQSLDFSAE